MINEHSQVWQRCIELLRESLDEQTIKTWFEPIKPVALRKNALLIQVPNKFIYETLEDRYVDELGKALVSILGNSARLEYQILVDNHRKIGKHTAVKNDDSLPRAFSTKDIKNPFIIPGIKKINIDPQLSRNYTFEEFVFGECNRLASSAGKAIALKPGKTAFNPLIIYGDVGLGKTHLAQAIGREVLQQNPSSQVLYVTTERFTNQVIQAIKNQAVNDLVNFYQMVDVLIVDDIHFLSNRPKTQEIFFNIFNLLHPNGKQIIMTCDRPPKDLKGVDDRLISRFKWGLVAELSAPDYDTRMKILELKMEREGLQLDEKIKEYICFNIKNNIRELEGVLVSLIAQSTLNRKEIDITLARAVVDQFVSQDDREVTVDNIKLLVAEFYKVPVEKLQGKTRKRDVVIARQTSMYLAKTYTNVSLKAIGDNFGGRDHSTVIYSVKAVQDMMDTDLVFRDQVAELEKQVQLSLQ